MQIQKVLGPLLALGLLVGCGGGGLVGPKEPAAGTLNLRLGADSIPGFSQVVVSVEKVEWSTDGSNWAALGNVKGTYDLAALQNGYGSAGVLLPSVSLSPVTISHFRITWATTNYASATLVPAFVTPAGSQGAALTMPLTTVVSGPVVVASGATTTAQIMLAGNQAVQGRGGVPSTYSFQATGRAYDLAQTARISGHLGVGATHLSGVEVYAESFSGTVASIHRRSLTDATGNYVLDALPVGQVYYVVAQPAGTPTAFYAKASNAITVAAGLTYSADLAFDYPLSAGTLALAITPASTSTEGTWAELRQTLPTGIDFQPFIVRTLTAHTATGQDQVSFAGLATSPAAPSNYSVRILRSAAGATPVIKDGTQQSVVVGTTTNYTLGF